ncbi:hypothetical protein UY286_21780 [Paenibacillus polymyxa]|uniref:hypothetical protein n=1 Tax=Paenibacillus polymyxa TaxID=1406 RepID=UPI002AB41ACE|nr:hypothetical protein [Paenibacillus polymyxa]MDY7993328.1 hypothetical protein [Paenibacillus polymyxa]MDY8120071.1 hypothetical protein [Paenibacillus polymyxa]
MNVTIKAHFNKQTKDSKKELVQFYVKGDDEHRPELNQLTREVVVLSIKGLEDVELTAEFKKSSKDSKKTILDFEVKGDSSAAQTFEFYKLAGSDVELTITESQMDIDEFREQQAEYREGVKGTIAQDGTVTVNREDDPNQAEFPLDDEEAAAAEIAASAAGGDNPDDDLPF